MALGVLDAVMFVLFLVSTFVYVIFLATIVRFRKKEPFNGAFFKICLVLGVCDVSNLLTEWLLAKFTSYGWLWMDILVNKWPETMAKVAVMLSWFFSFAQYNGVFLMSLNRLTAVVYPFKHNTYWTVRNLCLGLAAQLSVPALLVAPQVVMNFRYTYDNATESLVPLFLDPAHQLFYYLLALLYTTVINVATGCMYVAIFWKIHKLKTQVAGMAQQQSADKSDIKLAFFGFSIFVIMFVLGCFLYLMMTAESADTQALYLQIHFVIIDVFCWSNPWLSLAVGAGVRKHFVACLTCGPAPDDT